MLAKDHLQCQGDPGSASASGVSGHSNPLNFSTFQLSLDMSVVPTSHRISK